MKPPPSTIASPPLQPRKIAALASASVALLWIAQPPWMLWFASLFALVPWIYLIHQPGRFDRRSVLIVWLVSAIYYAVSLQGLRHAHPLMFVPALALSGYLAIYHVLFVLAVRRLLRHRIPLVFTVPIAWVAQECVRNYLLTGISALMLGHTMADIAIAIQIADLFGSYGVSFAIAMINVAVFVTLSTYRGTHSRREWVVSTAITSLLVIATLGYGAFRLQQPPGNELGTFALVQRSEPVEYVQSDERAVEIFQAYVSQSILAIRKSGEPIDVVVWPESMYSAGMPWMVVEDDAQLPPGANVTREEFLQRANEWTDTFTARTKYVQAALASVQPSSTPPHLLVGCGVIRYAQSSEIYSGVLSIRPDGTVEDWYGKTHLVMFGEYVPIAPLIPGLRSLIPPGMGLNVGPGAKQMQAGETAVAPVICIETAVERVILHQLARLRAQQKPIDAIVTVTNDGWFDNSSVIDHHLRCAQLVAVGCRCPILSSANNGPTAWIDSSGRVVQKLTPGTEGAIIAKPTQDTRVTFYSQVGDWPARICVLLVIALSIGRLSIGRLSIGRKPKQTEITETE